MALPLSSLSQFCPNIVMIRGSHAYSLDDIQLITQFWPNLRSIEAGHWHEPELLHLAQHCRQLQHLRANFPLLNVDKCQFVKAMPTTMQTLYLGDLWMMGWDYEDPSTWYQLLSALDLPNLRAFNRDAMSRLSESELLLIAERCDLHTLHLKPSDEVSDNTLQVLATLCPHL
jgi:hypothetical protein